MRSGMAWDGDRRTVLDAVEETRLLGRGRTLSKGAVEAIRPFGQAGVLALEKGVGRTVQGLFLARRALFCKSVVSWE